MNELAAVIIMALQTDYAHITSAPKYVCVCVCVCVLCVCVCVLCVCVCVWYSSGRR